ncbi:hypothetical protein QFC22_005378 [Naganishia vaughanmartiniae]|uniref:Uncharacterized protein n=1 Tax=Naganishia vaughanmartiniae TaxID=1424756 RepID=A0ACC2WV55_9TREE|nr:hypothetical protein QFC22_005378 [Naganishia vaughanmartiniae]
MTSQKPTPADKEGDRSRRLSLHRKTPSTGESAKSGASNSSPSPKSSTHRNLLKSPVKKAAGLINVISPARRSSDKQSSTAHSEPVVSSNSESTAMPAASAKTEASKENQHPSQMTSTTPEATQSLESLTMEDNALLKARQSQSGVKPATPTNLPSIISGGKLAINRPSTHSPPSLPPRSLYESMKPTPPKHVEDVTDMAVDPASSDHVLEPELIAIEDAEPRPPPLIYEVENTPSRHSTLPTDSKTGWDTTAQVQAADYSMWDDTNSVPLNLLNAEHAVDNSLNMSDTIQGYHFSTRNHDLETHSTLGPGMTYMCMLRNGVHAGHQAVAFLPEVDQDTGEISADFVKNTVRCLPRFPDDSADSSSSSRWLFCLDCSGWFRLITGNSASTSFSETFKLSDEFDEQLEAEGPQAKIKAIQKAIALGSQEHRRSHHFHQVTDVSSRPPAQDVDLQAAGISIESINIEAMLSSFHCCYCGLFLAYDPTPTIPSTYSPGLLKRLLDREPLPGDNSSAGIRYSRALKMLHTVLYNILVGKQPPSVKADAKAFIDKIGSDQVGYVFDELEVQIAFTNIILINCCAFRKDLMMTSGFRLIEVEDDEVKRPRWALSIDDEATNKLARRAWLELEIHLMALDNGTFTGVLFTAYVRLSIAHSILHPALPISFKSQDLSSVVYSGLTKAMASPGHTAGPEDRRNILDATYPSAPLGVHTRTEPPSVFRVSSDEIGCSLYDTANAIGHAVINQTICNSKNTPLIMDAFEMMATHADTQNFFGAEEAEKLQSSFVTLKSSGLPTSGQSASFARIYHTRVMLILRRTNIEDLRNAYSLLSLKGDDIVKLESSEDSAALLSSLLQVVRQILGMPENEEPAAQALSPEQRKHREETLGALQTLANGYGNPEFIKAVESLREEALELSDALKVLEIDDASSISPEFWEILYKSYVVDVPESFQRTKVRNAFDVIAKRLSPIGLSELLSTGKHMAPVLPAGLFNIGNTCYLNSLLQYLYAIRDLRLGLEARQIDTVKPITDSHIVVGGRTVAETELERSRRFVQELVRLFRSLDGSEENAVRPEKELAYLALVTAADEVNKEPPSDMPSGATDSTLVNDEPMELDGDLTQSTPAAGKSVLGKRSTEERDVPEASATETLPEKNAATDIPISPPTIQPLPASPSETQRQIKPLRAASNNGVQSPPAMEQPPPLELETSAGIPESALVVDSETAPDVGPMPPPLPPRQHRPSMTSDMMFGQQHDISECMDNVLFQVEAALSSSGTHGATDVEDNLIKRLFYGKARQQLLLPPKIADTTSASELVPQPSVEVVFNNILLSVNEDRGMDLYDKLHDVYFGLDDIEIDGVKGKKSEMPETLPPLLHIQLQRVQFDLETKSAFKSNAYIKFAETLALDRFLPSADQEKREKSMSITRRIASLRTTLNELQYNKSGPVADDLTNLKEALFSLDPEQEQLYSALEAESTRVKQAVTEAEKEIVDLRAEMDALWQEDKECEYDLSSIFMHRGSAGFGHYWLYQRNLPDNPDQYFQFNDETVRLANPKEVLQDTTGSNANPYLLVYAKKNSGAIEVMTKERKKLLASAQNDMVAET